MKRRTAEVFSCPACGADVPVNAKACPECGSDEETGWSEETEYDGLDLPTNDDEDDEMNGDRPRATPWEWAVIAAAVLLLIVIVVFRRGTL